MVFRILNGIGLGLKEVGFTLKYQVLVVGLKAIRTLQITAEVVDCLC